MNRVSVLLAEYMFLCTHVAVQTSLCLCQDLLCERLFGSQAVGIYEQALAAVPTPRMFSLYATYLEDVLTHDAQGQQDVLQQLLQLCKRAFQAGQYTETNPYNKQFLYCCVAWHAP